ncbi:MAG: peptidoglycan DD-metalloendopeptidase family protein [Thermodesulfobacteriota bacterium]
MKIGEFAVLKRVSTLILAVCLLLPSWASASGDVSRDIIMGLEYGIEGDDLQIKKDVIKRRQNISEILLNADVSYNKIHEAVEKSKSVFDVRKIQVGNPYCLINAKKNEKNTCYFVYERNPIDYVVFEIGDSVQVYQRSKPVRIRHRTVEGAIDSSLWNAFAEQDLDFEMAMKLSEIYAWSIDFYHFQEGDRFKFIFEEKWVGERRVGTGRILAARITFRGDHYYGFYFPRGRENGGYFDENGRSLRKAFLKAPLKFVRISSGYSKSRLHPILNEYKKHLGTDYAAPTGTPVVSVGDGVIEKMGYNGSMGNYLQIRHTRRYMTQYLHLSRFAENLRRGDSVSQGDVIGYVGSTGMATGPHLDFRFWVGDQAVNFLKQDIPTADPVPSRHEKTYFARIAELKTDLDRDQILHYSAESVQEENEG